MSDDTKDAPNAPAMPAPAAVSIKADSKKTADFEYAYPLTKPIKAYDEEISVIKYRKPNGGDLIAVNNPVTFYPYEDPVRVEHDMPRMVKMLARLSGIPSSSIAMLEPDDLIGLAWAVSPFFIPKP